MRIELKTTKARQTKTYVTSMITISETRVVTVLNCDEHEHAFTLGERTRVNLVTLNQVRACPKAWCPNCKGTETE